MIKTRLKGRLGNQLFIYGFAKRLCYEYGTKALIYDRCDEKDNLWHSHLSRYKLSSEVEFTSNKAEIFKMPLSSKVLFLKDRIAVHSKNGFERQSYQRKHFDENLRHGLLLMYDGYFELPQSIPDNLFCDGYFQSPKFIDPIKTQLLSDLRPIKPYNDDECSFLKEIKNSNSVCLTIRLGDYIGNSTHQVCTKQYYINAMRLMREYVPDCKFFVFSDDIEESKRIFNFEFPVIYDSGKSEDAISLDIMSNCKHFIISNSSFSWWAQYLSQNENKIVISPDRWYAEDFPCDIMEDNWIKLKC